MTRYLVVGGWTAILVGVALTAPVAAANAESRPGVGASLPLLLTGIALIAGGGVGVLAGRWRGTDTPLPSGVRAAMTANVLFLAFCALELSDRLVRQEGRVFYWTTLLFLPSLLILCGLALARGWAWWVTRGLTATACLWFLGFIAVIPFADLHGEDGPTPWYGRVYVIIVSLAFAGIAAAAFWSLGRTEARNYFRLTQAEGISPSEAAPADQTAG